MIWCIYILWYLSIDCFFEKTCTSFKCTYHGLSISQWCSHAKVQSVNMFVLTWHLKAPEMKLYSWSVTILHWDLKYTKQIYVHHSPSTLVQPGNASSSLQPNKRYPAERVKHQVVLQSSGKIGLWNTISLSDCQISQVISDELWNWINHQHPLKSGSCFWFTFIIFPRLSIYWWLPYMLSYATPSQWIEWTWTNLSKHHSFQLMTMWTSSFTWNLKQGHAMKILIEWNSCQKSKSYYL